MEYNCKKIDEKYHDVNLFHNIMLKKNCAHPI